MENRHDCIMHLKITKNFLCNPWVKLSSLGIYELEILIISIVYRYFYFPTYCFISWALSPADGAVHWHIKYCKGTARTKRTNCSARGISVLQQLVYYNEEHSTQLRLSTRWRFFATPLSFTTFRDVVDETCQDMKLFSVAHRACKLFRRTTNQ